MNPPTQEDIARRAYQLWEERGRPEGTDVGLWLEAESQLIDAQGAGATSRSSESAAAETGASDGDSAVPAGERESRDAIPAPTVPTHAVGPTPSEREAITAALQKQAARAPQTPHHAAPSKPQPAPPGKPVWKQAHSS